MQAASAPLSSKTRMRNFLGDRVYRIVTQTPRILNFLINPHYEHEAKALSSLVSSGSYCLDIGANYGHYSRLLSPMVGSKGNIYAFEPSSITFNGLKMVKRVLRLSNVHIIHSALADVSGELTLTIPIKAHGGLGIALAHLGNAIDREGIKETVAVTTLDSFMAARNITQCDLIKCDVEGAELLVLKGAAETLARHKPNIIIEIDATYLRRNSHTIQDVESYLFNLGYQLFTWQEHGLHPVAHLQDRSNNIAIHPDRRTNTNV